MHIILTAIFQVNSD